MNTWDIDIRLKITYTLDIAQAERGSLWQFPADLDRSAGCQQSIFPTHDISNFFFSTLNRANYFFLQQIVFYEKTIPPPPLVLNGRSLNIVIRS